MKRLAMALVTLTSLISLPSHAQNIPAAASSAQSQPSSGEMQILRDKIKADKKFLVASNMKLTDDQALVFWPIYDAYQADQEKINQRIAKMVASYADAWNNNTLNNDMAKKLTTELLAIEQAEVDLRKGYRAKLDKVLPAMVTARYLQVEGKIRAIVRYDAVDRIPLIQGGK